MSEAMATREERASEEIVVGSASELPPGSQKLVRVRNIEVGVFNVNGTYYALHSMCPHQWGPLCHGHTTGEMVCNATTDWKFKWHREGELLICPWHGMEFDLKTGQSCTVARMRVRTFPVRVVDGEVRLQVRNRPSASAPAESTPSTT